MEAVLYGEPYTNVSKSYTKMVKISFIYYGYILYNSFSSTFNANAIRTNIDTVGSFSPLSILLK